MKKVFLLVLLSCLVLPQLAFGGAWTLPRNDIWIEYVTKASWAKDDFGPDKDLTRKGADARSWGWGMIPKAEYGITDWFTLMGSLEYKEAKYKEYARNPAWGPYSVKNHGVTNVDFGGKFRFLKEPVVLSGQIKAQIYTAYDKGKTGVANQPGLSDRFDAIEFRGLISRKWDTKIPFYLSSELGYRFKNRGIDNDMPFFVEGGFWAFDWLLLKTEVDGFWSHDGTGNFEKEYAIWRIGPTFQLLGAGSDNVAKTESSFDISVQYGITFWGRNTSADQEVILKVAAQY